MGKHLGFLGNHISILVGNHSEHFGEIKLNGKTLDKV